MKLTERLLLRVDEDTAKAVRALAERQERTIHGQLRFLITAGLNHALLSEGKVTSGQSRKVRATRVNSGDAA